MIERDLADHLRELSRLYSVVTVTGPRQSGKTTLCRATFPRLSYVTLEPLDVREAAIQDPRGFLAEHQDGAIIDEVQRAPELLSYLQAEIDERPAPGRFILTGSQHLGLSAQISQSLAGRTGILELLPPSWRELQRFDNAPKDLFEVLWAGAYPRIFDRSIPPHQWLADYVATYVQRDVRQLLRVGDLRTFTDFLRLCAGRTAAEINLSALGGDAGVSHNTARAWLSVLEASYLAIRLPAWHSNIKKQIVRAPKLHFLDTGLVCYLLGIREAEQLRHHPLRGAVFETWVASEVYKQIVHRGERPRLFHYRDAKGLEVDLVVEPSDGVILAEAKSGATVAGDFMRPVERLADLVRKREKARDVTTRVVYGGNAAHTRLQTAIVPWAAVDRVKW